MSPTLSGRFPSIRTYDVTTESITVEFHVIEHRVPLLPVSRGNEPTSGHVFVDRLVPRTDPYQRVAAAMHMAWRPGPWGLLTGDTYGVGGHHQTPPGGPWFQPPSALHLHSPVHLDGHLEPHWTGQLEPKLEPWLPPPPPPPPPPPLPPPPPPPSQSWNVSEPVVPEAKAAVALDREPLELEDRRLTKLELELELPLTEPKLLAEARLLEPKLLQPKLEPLESGGVETPLSPP